MPRAFPFPSTQIPTQFVTPAKAGAHEANRTCGVAVGSQAAHTSHIFNTDPVETLVGTGLRRYDEIWGDGDCGDERVFKRTKRRVVRPVRVGAQSVDVSRRRGAGLASLAKRSGAAHAFVEA